MGPGVRAHPRVEGGEALAEVQREDVPPGAGPLTQLDESGTRSRSHPQQGVQPEGGPARGHQGQGAQQEQGAELEEQHQCAKAEAEEKHNAVHLDFGERLLVRGVTRGESRLLARGCGPGRRSDCTPTQQRDLGDVG